MSDQQNSKGRGLRLGGGWRLDWPRGPRRIAMVALGLVLVVHAIWGLWR